MDLEKIHFVPLKEKKEPLPQNLDLLQAFVPLDVGTLIKQRLNCHQTIFRKPQADGAIDILWVIHNPGESNGYIKSPYFESYDSMLWNLVLHPQAGKLALRAIPRQDQNIQRDVKVQF